MEEKNVGYLEFPIEGCEAGTEGSDKKLPARRARAKWAELKAVLLHVRAKRFSLEKSTASTQSQRSVLLASDDYKEATIYSLKGCICHLSPASQSPTRLRCKARARRRRNVRRHFFNNQF